MTLAVAVAIGSAMFVAFGESAGDWVVGYAPGGEGPLGARRIGDRRMAYSLAGVGRGGVSWSSGIIDDIE